MLFHLAQAIEASDFGTYLRESQVWFPVLNLVHVLGLLVAAGTVEDAVAKIDARRGSRLDDEDLVGADAEAPVAEPAHLRGRQREGRAGGVEHDEIVARALHLGEAQSHVRAIIGARSRGAGGRVLNTRPARPPAAS